jgi:hypothetical protein
MDLQETAKLLTMIQALFWISGKQQSEDQFKMTVIAWQEMLNDVSYEEAKTALKLYASDNSFPPHPSDILLFVAKTREPEAFISGEEAWEIVKKAATKIGFYRQKEAYETFSPRVLRAVKIIGWEKICRSEKPEFVKKDFCQVYDNIAKSEQESLKLPLWSAIHVLPKYGEVKENKERGQLPEV